MIMLQLSFTTAENACIICTAERCNDKTLTQLHWPLTAGGVGRTRWRHWKPWRLDTQYGWRRRRYWNSARRKHVRDSHRQRRRRIAHHTACLTLRTIGHHQYHAGAFYIAHRHDDLVAFLFDLYTHPSRGLVGHSYRYSYIRRRRGVAMYSYRTYSSQS